MEGKLNGKRQRGLPRHTWTSGIKEWMSKSYTDCVRSAQERNVRRTMIMMMMMVPRRKLRILEALQNWTQPIINNAIL